MREIEMSYPLRSQQSRTTQRTQQRSVPGGRPTSATDVSTQSGTTQSRSMRTTQGERHEMKRLISKRSSDEGFTLIELLIVIIILGILAAIVVFAVGNTRKDSVANSCKTDVKSVELSAEAVNTKSGTYPATSDAGTAAPN